MVSPPPALVCTPDIAPVEVLTISVNDGDDEQQNKKSYCMTLYEYSEKQNPHTGVHTRFNHFTPENPGDHLGRYFGNHSIERYKEKQVTNPNVYLSGNQQFYKFQQNMNEHGEKEHFLKSQRSPQQGNHPNYHLDTKQEEKPRRDIVLCIHPRP